MTAKRQLLIQPYEPDYTENLGDNTGQFAAEDIGKAVKLSGDTMVLCASGDPIEGFVQSVEPGTVDGHSIGSVRKRGRQYAIDEAGSLAVGDLVEAGTAGTLGTHALQNVIVQGTPVVGEKYWTVIGITTGLAASQVLVEYI